MNCSRCGEPLPFILCTECKGEVLEKSLYCSWCGVRMAKEEKKEEESDFAGRKLCSDGACIGVINERGVCNACGRPYTGEPT
jgi:hypothetical protein